MIKSFIGKSAVGFAKTVRNPSFLGGYHAKNVRQKTDLAFWLDFLFLFYLRKKKIKRIIPFFICVNFVFYFFEFKAQVEIKNTIPNYFIKNVPINFNVTINKTAFVTDFARYQIEIPQGFNIKAVESKGGKFSYGKQIAKIVWVQIPSDSSFTVTFQMEATEKALNTGKSIERFIYIENKQREETKVIIKRLTVVEHEMQIPRDSLKISSTAENKKVEVNVLEIPANKSFALFRIQLGAFKIKPSPQDFKHIGEVDIQNINGIYKVFYGNFNTAEKAQKQAQKFKQKGIDSFVTEIKN